MTPLPDSPRISFLARYAVKGLSGEALQTAVLEAGGHFPGDRLYAIENGPSGFDGNDPQHQPKIKYLVLMRNPALARLRTVYDDTTGVLGILRDDALLASGDLGTDAGRSAIEAFCAREFADELRGPPKVLVAPEHYRFMDSRSGFVSLLNLASVRTIGAAAGRATFDPIRFRANIGIEGLPPWGEFDLVGKEIGIGEVVLRISKPTERCAATHVDPKAGVRDLNVMGLLEREYGHMNCGVYAEIVRGGKIRTGDPLEI